MATFDQLSAEQRAIIELVLKQHQEYEQLGTMLGLPTSRVRELAREALVRLSPVSAAAVDDDWRGQLADYLLNQQTGPEATATKGHLRRSEAARGWARSVLDSLDQFYDQSNMPTIPEGEPAAAPRRERKPKAERKPTREGKDGAARAGWPRMDTFARRRLLGGIGLAVVALFVVLVWPVGALDRRRRREARAPRRPATRDARIIGQLVLRPVGNTELQGRRRGRGRRARRPAPADRAGPADAEQEPPGLRGVAVQLADRRALAGRPGDRPERHLPGRRPAAGELRAATSSSTSRSRSVDQNRKHSGNSVLRGQLDQLQAPPANTQNGQSGAADDAAQQPAPQTTTPGQ